MFTHRFLVMAAWTAACMVVPALSTLDPLVKPAIDKIPNRPAPAPFVLPNTPPPNVPSPIKNAELKAVKTVKVVADPSNARRYDDGQVYRGAQVGPNRGRPIANHVRNGGWFPGKAIGRGIGRFFRRGGFFRRGRC